MLETSIFSNLIHNEEFSKLALPHLKEDYFSDVQHKIIFNLISSFTIKYGKRPTTGALLVDLDQVGGYNDDLINEVKKTVSTFEDGDDDTAWLLDSTEKFCQDKAIYNGLMESISIYNGENKKLSKGSIPQLLSEALGVTFNNSIGHDYLEDFEQRFEFYHNVENKIPFDINYLNLITAGGLPNKSLTVYLGGTGSGKTILMCHQASAAMMIGKNVLYVTLEMPEEKISERIDANLLNVNIATIPVIPKATYMKKMEKLRSKCTGKLIVREYPPTTAGAQMIDGLISELKLKKRFVPDIIFIDYINICKSDRLAGSASNSFAMIKAVSEELRGLAVKHDVPVVSATQVNRDGLDSSDLSMSNISESIGIAFTCDLIIGLIATEELEQTGQMMFKQLKNRFNDVNKYRKFTVGLDKSKMRFYDVEQTQLDYSEEGQKDKKDKSVFDNSKFGQRAAEDDQMKFMTQQQGRKNFSALC